MAQVILPYDRNSPQFYLLQFLLILLSFLIKGIQSIQYLCF